MLLAHGNAFEFIIDSGASTPMCKDKDAFSTLNPMRVPVKVANGNTIYTAGIGRIGNFENIYYVPELTFNLISVGYLNDLGFTVTFNVDNTVTLQDLHGQTQVIGARQNGLFHTLPTFFKPHFTAMYSLSLQVPKPNLIAHYRLMHISESYIATAQRLQLVHGLQCSTSEYHFIPFCDACALAKSTRVSASYTPGSSHNIVRARQTSKLPSSSPPSKLSCQACHKYAMDIKGPLPLSYKKTKYMLLFTCTCIRHRIVYHLRTKDETSSYIRKFILHIRQLHRVITHLDVNIGILKSDNGTEFINDEVKSILSEFNITHQTTSPHSPHQNGIAERSNRTVAELAVASMIAGKVPMYLYPYAIDTVIFVLNALPCEALHMTSTPVLEMSGTTPDLSWLRAYGCDAYIHLPDHRRPNFGVRAVKGILIGYGLLEETQSLAYLIYYNHSVHKVGHAHFNEDSTSRHSDNSELLLQFNELMNKWDNNSPDAPPDHSNNSPPVPIPPTIHTDSTAPIIPTFPEDPTPPGKPVQETRRRSTRIQAAEQKAKYSKYCAIDIEDSMHALLFGNWFDNTFDIVNHELSPFYSLASELGISPTYEEAMKSSEWPQWRQAIMDELTKLIN
jgi:hypothetical protein